MLLFVLMHFANHALGLVSLQVMEQGRQWLMIPWRHPVGQALLITSLLVHLLLGLWGIYRRRTLRMPGWEALQILLGLLVAPLLTYHVLGVMGSRDIVRPDALSTWTLTFFSSVDTFAGSRQFVLFCAVWLHACIGVHFWLRMRAGYRRAYPVVFSMMLLIPVVAFLGLTQAAREVHAQIDQYPDGRAFSETLKIPANAGSAYSPYSSYAPYSSDSGYGSDPYAASTTPAPSTSNPASPMLSTRQWVLLTLALLLLTALAARALRAQLAARKTPVRVHYLNGPTVSIPRGWSVLEASRAEGIAHTSVCGGRARCSTCRIRVSGDTSTQPPPSELEQRVLDRIGASPNVRLACQLRPTDELTVSPLLAAAPLPSAADDTRRVPGGEERDVTVLFADLRGFTRLAERKLPYDVVFLLNRYFEAVGSAVEHCGGITNQFTGDGVMALFGVHDDTATGCRQALVAAGEIARRIDALSAQLGDELPAPLAIGIGIHTGSAVVGEMGYEGTRYLTAVGDTTNTASRLEAMTKEFGCQLVVSVDAATIAGVNPTPYPKRQVTLRNREQTLDVLVIADARELAGNIGQAETVAA